MEQKMKCDFCPQGSVFQLCRHVMYLQTKDEGLQFRQRNLLYFWVWALKELAKGEADGHSRISLEERKSLRGWDWGGDWQDVFVQRVVSEFPGAEGTQ